jgi:Methyltransferase FkbM domain
MISGRHDRSTAYAIILGIVIIINLGMSSKQTGFFLKSPLLSTSTPSTSTEWANTPRTSRLGDGCYHVFMDVGANIGVHGRFLFEPHMYPLSKVSVPFFDSKFGKHRANEDYCVFAIEANPNHWPRLKMLSDAYAAVGWRLNYVQAAAGDQNGTMVFYHQGKQDTKHNEWGFSVKQIGRPQDVTAVDVPTIRLTEWIQREILEREIPQIPPSGRHYPKPVLGMKMDIEGSEYIVLPDLMLSGVYCQLGFVFGEGHQRFAPLNFTGQKADLSTRENIKIFQDAVTSAMQASRNCQAELHFGDVDDESYLHDGIPFPDPNRTGKP